MSVWRSCYLFVAIEGASSSSGLPLKVKLVVPSCCYRLGTLAMAARGTVASSMISSFAPAINLLPVVRL